MAKPEKATYRPVTPLEAECVAALSRCTLPPATMTKRFARDLKDQVAARNEISEKQAAYLLVCCYRYRRQIPKHLVPDSPPPGYTTPKQQAALQKYQAAMQQTPNVP